ncbi:MAG: ABC transporter permease subunit [Clostridiales bacterium]|jgi:spermidine/putrescine transport system permease protein|nr:ABC transporter permease subunit [Clostridiales bacterium]
MKNRTKLPNIYLGIVTAIMYLPILIVIIYSFNESRISSVWEGFSFKWYADLFRDKSILDALINSIILASLSSLSAGVIGTLAAVGMTKVKLRTNSTVEYIATLPIIIPEIILGIIFLLYFSLLGLRFGMTTLIIAHTTFCVPYVLILVKARLAGMDKSFVEAARDLGASGPRAFFDITLPLILPAVASGMLLSFAMSFDDVVISVFVTGVNVNTLPLKIYTSLKTGVTPKINALCTLMFIATIILIMLSAYLGKLNRINTTDSKEETL